MSTSSNSTKLKFVRINDDKQPIEKWKDNINLSDNYTELRGASLVIPKGIVIIDRLGG